MSLPNPAPDEEVPVLKRERRSQLRTLLLLAVAAIIFEILRSGPARIFNPGWWRLW